MVVNDKVQCAAVAVHLYLNVKVCFFETKTIQYVARKDQEPSI